jgi:hypothetical protein
MSQVTTLRCHLEVNHSVSENMLCDLMLIFSQGKYHCWLCTVPYINGCMVLYDGSGTCTIRDLCHQLMVW